jgi:serralysin
LADIAGDRTTTAVITVGATASNTLEVAGDHDWYRISLTQGQSITVTLTSGTIDCYLRILDASGNVLFENDDSGGTMDSRVSFKVPASGTYYIDVGAYDDDADLREVGPYELAVDNYTPPPTGTVDQFADQLVNGYWSGDSHHFAVTQGGSLTVNLTGLTTEGKTFAREALKLWSDIVGVRFVEVTSGGQITFDDNEEDAFADGVWSGGITQSAHVNISTQWLADYRENGLESYAFQTYVHEIGHALGLGHAGDYNGEGTYPFDSTYENDGWPMSVMSYFDQVDSSYYANRQFSPLYTVTPMLADIQAMSILYGLSTTTRTGNTTYGFNSTAGRDVFDAVAYPNVAYTIFDSGGTDTLDYSGFSASQRITLEAESFFDVGGRIGNVVIARGTVIENATGGSGNDTLIGNTADNLLVGNAGDDLINGNEGNDRLRGGAGDDSLSGAAGRDTVLYDNAAAGVTVDLGGQSAVSTAAGDAARIGSDRLFEVEDVIGSAFDDRLTGAWWADNRLDGGAGNDSLFGDNGRDTLIGGSGDDLLDGGAGQDLASYASAAAGVKVSLALSGAQNSGQGSDTLVSIEDLEGSGFADGLTGDGAANVLRGLGGDDELNGGGGADLLVGGGGNDVFVVEDAGDKASEAAGEGRDQVRSSISFVLGANLEELLLTGTAAVAGTGNGLGNLIRGNAAANVLDGLDGADELLGEGGDDSLDGGTGDDRLFGGAGNDTLFGNAGYDRMYGGVGNDTYLVTDATSFAYELAGEGRDTVVASIDHQLRAEVEELVLNGTANLIGKGNASDNRIAGNDGNNRVYGYDGADTLEGRAGDDYLMGGAGNDTLSGGAGHDRMYGGLGDDRYLVGDTADYAYENAGEGTDRVIATTNHVLRANIEQLELGGSADLRGYGNALDNLVAGNGGANLLYGRDGNDQLLGSGGSDILFGENGSDRLVGGAGQDRAYGGAGGDEFIFGAGDLSGMSSSTADRIHDFSRAEGDRIRLDGIDADTVRSGDQSFAFIGENGFSGAAGELRYQQISGNTFVQGDTNGDGAADFWIRLDGLHTLGTADFFL